MLLTVIMSCQKHQYLWPALLERAGPNAIVFCGGSLNPKREGRTVWLDCADTYEGLPEKMIALMRFVLADPSYAHVTHILKVDDNDGSPSVTIDPTVLELDYVGQAIQRTPGTRTWHFGKVTKGSWWDERPYDGTFVPWAKGGYTYILSRRAISLCVTAADAMGLETLRRTEIYEDIMIAKMLRGHGIVPHKRSFGIQTQHTTTPGKEAVRDHLQSATS
jgi:hypothetical protein